MLEFWVFELYMTDIFFGEYMVRAKRIAYEAKFWPYNAELLEKILWEFICGRMECMKIAPPFFSALLAKKTEEFICSKPYSPKNKIK